MSISLSFVHWRPGVECCLKQVGKSDDWEERLRGKKNAWNCVDFGGFVLLFVIHLGKMTAERAVELEHKGDLPFICLSFVPGFQGSPNHSPRCIGCPDSKVPGEEIVQDEVVCGSKGLSQFFAHF